MQLPDLDGNYMNLVIFGTYTQGRLLASKLAEWAEEVRLETESLLQAGRAVEDARRGETLERALRDASDTDLDDVAEQGRLVLASASKNAMKEAPYTEIHPNGIDYYTEAPLDQQESRYRELAERYVRFLPEDHPVVPNASSILAGLDTWLAARRKADDAKTATGLKRTAYDTQAERWAETMERIYGRLIEKHRRRGAERYFARRARGRDAADEATEVTE